MPEYRIPGPRNVDSMTARFRGTPGPVGTNDEGDPSFASTLMGAYSKGKEWKKQYETAKEWIDRFENYTAKDKRCEQFLDDSVKLPEEILEALGFDLEQIAPITKIMDFEIKVLVNVIKASIDTEKKLEQAQQDWDKAAEIARNVRPRLESILQKTGPPSTNIYVARWQAIHHLVNRHRAGNSGIMMGQYGLIRYSSPQELRAIAGEARDKIFRKTAKVLAAYIFLALQFWLLTKAQEASELAMQKMRNEAEDSRTLNPGANLAAIMVFNKSIEQMADRYTAQGSAEGDPKRYVTNLVKELDSLTSQWVAEAQYIAQAY